MPAPPKRGIRQIRSEYEHYLREAGANGWQPKCHSRPDVFADYEEPATQDAAKAACARCPVLLLCNEYALATKPSWGILGGVSWDDGRQAA